MSDLVGKRYGKLTVIERAGSDKYKQALWLCKCECGNTKITNTNRLNAGKTKSCGCTNKGNTSHGLCGTRIHAIHRDMLARCNNPHKTRYERYGGRGIKVCDEWKGKEGLTHFYHWSIENGYTDNLTIDRIDKDGNYEPSNCRWVGYKAQSNNTSRNIYINIDNQTHTLAEWCEIRNLEYTKVYQRIHTLKWSYERALEI